MKIWARYDDVSGRILGFRKEEDKPKGNLIEITNEQYRKILSESSLYYRVKEEELVFVGEDGVPPPSKECIKHKLHRDMEADISNVRIDEYTYNIDQFFQLNLLTAIALVDNKVLDKVKLWRLKEKADGSEGTWEFHAHTKQELLKIMSLLNAKREICSAEFHTKLKELI